jgi:hypothetical protein
VLTGAAPALTVGAAYSTTCVAVGTLLTLTSAGQAICGGLLAGVDGPLGECDPQAAASRPAASTTRRRGVSKAVRTSSTSWRGTPAPRNPEPAWTRRRAAQFQC